MSAEDLIHLALDILSCTQKDLAQRLKVSSTQISKWKKGEYMSFDMEKKLRALIGIGDLDPAFVRWAGSIDQAKKWQRLMFYLADKAYDNAETGYNTTPLKDERELLCGDTIRVLNDMGVARPSAFPQELDFDYDAIGEDEDCMDEQLEKLEENAYAALIDSIYLSLNDVYGFYAAYVSHLMDDDALNLLDTPACNIDSGLLALAASKVEVDTTFAPNAHEFRYQINRDYKKWLTIAKDCAFRAGIPLRAELMDLVYDDNDMLGHTAEAESLGFNASRLHPDIYMNELLVGMRMIHQILPVIMKKLEIYDDFTLDDSGLRIG